MKKCLISTVFAIAAIGSVSMTGAIAQETVRMGWAAAPTHITPVLFAKTDILKNYGNSYTVEAIRFRGSPPQVAALASGDVDIAALSGAALTGAVKNAGLDLRVIGDLLGDGRPGHYSLTFMVANDSGINDISDLRGRKLAVNAIGSAGDTAMRIMLRQNDLEDSDFTTVEAGLRNHTSLLTEGEVDMAMVLPNFLGAMQASGNFKTLFTMADAIGQTQSLVLVARADFIEENRDILVDLMEDWVTGVRWFLDPANIDAAHAVVGEVTDAPPDRFGFAFTENDFQRDINGLPNIEGFQKTIDLAVDAGVLPERLEVEPGFVDLSIVNEALDRTGRQ
jgi:NitT/TauT family transport system substrate-binding protein